ARILERAHGDEVGGGLGNENVAIIAIGQTRTAIDGGAASGGQFGQGAALVERAFGVAAVDARRRTARPDTVGIAGRTADPLMVAAIAGEDGAAAIVIIGHI